MPHLVFIDDDQPSLILYEEICRKEGFEYTGIHNPLDTMSLLPPQEQISIVFVDLEMPRMDGFQVLSMLRFQPKLASVPIIACTVYNSSIEQARAAGFNGFITKPLNIDRFSSHVMAILRGQPIWQLYGD